ncbi:uncharacterized protein LOC132259063 [Phlebotomus argentipes]|uniref:uncharacterized protein LOC132259063 n=1 Tax=Phlebotomus argentipes TaxID=94469 RepID=UPI002892DBD1|nr:uncharacterized protein LOC132259063 [Phlebotomus argentipes]
MGKVRKVSDKSSGSAEKGSAGGPEKAGVLTKSVGIKKKSKREKFSQKRKNLRLRLNAAAPGEAKKAPKKRKRKPKVKVGLDFKSLKDALPSLESLVKFRSAEIKTGVPEYDKKTEPSNRFKKLSKKAQKAKRISSASAKNVARMGQLEQLMQDRTFRENPRLVIAEHVRNTRKLEDEMED